MVIVPQTNIILLKTPMELSDNNQLTWSSLEEQFNYFYNLPKLSLDDATYQRKEGVIRFPTNNVITYEDLIHYNYCMYQNEAYDNKWFYAYITEINYVNDGMSTIKLETDAWNTWWNDLTFYQSFVEREHVNDDTIGKHTIPEGLEKGDFLSSENSMFIYSSGNANVLCVGVSMDLISPYYALKYNGIYNGLSYIALENADSLSVFLKWYASEGATEQIVSLFMIPLTFISDSIIPSWVSKTVSIDGAPYTFSYIEVPTSDIEFNLGTKTLTRPSQLGVGNDKYTPKNNKLLTNEYMYLLVDNMCGSTAKYDYEYFNDPSSCVFQCYGAITPGCSIKTFPKNYKNVENNYSEGITNAKLPVCGWQSDIYTNWLTQNGINIPVNIISAIGTGLVGGITAVAGEKVMGGNMILNSLTSITSTMSEIYQHRLSPYQAEGNTNVGDVMFSIGNILPMFYKMTIKKEYAQILDRYFDLYGYKVNILKVPNIRGRLNWNYVKTIGCNITGDIPQLDLEKIKSLFDNGITFWHHTNTFLDYSQSNTIVS